MDQNIAAITSEGAAPSYISINRAGASEYVTVTVRSRQGCANNPAPVAEITLTDEQWRDLQHQVVESPHRLRG